MSDADFFAHEIARLFPTNHTTLWPAIEQRFAAIAPDIAFAATSSNPMDRRLHFCAYFLATIQALEARGENFESIRQTCRAIATAYVEPRTSLHRWLRRLPSLLIRTPLRQLAVLFLRKKTGVKGHANGFLVQIVTDAASTHGLRYGIDILECGVVKLFRKHHAEHYVPILCDVDELTTALAGFQMLRTGTIARGATHCDFRYRLR